MSFPSQRPDSPGSDAELKGRDEVIVFVLRDGLGGVCGPGERGISPGPELPLRSAPMTQLPAPAPLLIMAGPILAPAHWFSPGPQHSSWPPTSTPLACSPSATRRVLSKNTSDPTTFLLQNLPWLLSACPRKPKLVSTVFHTLLPQSRSQLLLTPVRPSVSQGPALAPPVGEAQHTVSDPPSPDTGLRVCALL